MDIRPILSTLRRHKTAAALIVLEVALSCAIICNAVFLISTRLQRMDRPTGMADSELVRINIAGIGDDEKAGELAQRDVAALRGLPGVKAATALNHVPFDNSSWNSSIQLAPEQERPSASANVYLGDAVVDTLGLTLAFSVGPNPVDGGWRLSRERLAEQGQAAAASHTGALAGRGEEATAVGSGVGEAGGDLADGGAKIGK